MNTAQDPMAVVSKNYGVDLNSMLQGKDLNSLLQGKDLNSLLQGKDLNSLLQGKDLNSLLQGKDLNSLLQGKFGGGNGSSAGNNNCAPGAGDTTGGSQVPSETPNKGTTNDSPANGADSNSNTNSNTNSGNGSLEGTNKDSSSFAVQVVDLVNQERTKAGLKPLTSDKALTGMALDKAKDMYNNNYFDHNSPTFGSPFDMMKTYGITYSYAGENIAKGQRTPQEVMNSWMNSAGHRQNILSPNFTQIGVAYYNGEWVQEFIAK
ncbi:serine protease [Paenibacillus piri]|uniref:Serine protease n=2 Tax=Paenibacillus piri TaxID=2547395 RepID=A0A4R5KC29_9BACL|nr:serine protease [Paenibacillus piri]